MAAIKDILEWFEARGNQVLISDETPLDQTITVPRGIHEAKEGHLSFISNKHASEFEALVKSTSCKVIIIDKNLLDDDKAKELSTDISFILSNNPKKDLIECSKTFFGSANKTKEPQVDPKASIADDCSIGSEVSIGAFVVIEEQVTIGSRCVIGAGSVIKSNTTIGDDVIIGSCNVIGGDGFGYIKNEDTSEYEQFPHYGGVIIKDKVHIGNNTCIDRGSLRDTTIGMGVKIDNLVHIAHNVRIGDNSLVIACSMIAGSVDIGENSWVAPSSTVLNGITIGKNTTIGLASTVTKNLADGQTVMGSPAMPKEDFAILRKQQKETIRRNKGEYR